MAKREPGCPLCGARLTPDQLLDACTAIVDAELGVLACTCPYCQGYFEIRPTAESLDIGYMAANGERFDVALSVPCPGTQLLKTVDAKNPARLDVIHGDRVRIFHEC